jgi:hypothetical protein
VKIHKKRVLIKNEGEKEINEQKEG